MKKNIATICEVLVIFGFLVYVIASGKRTKPMPNPTPTPTPNSISTPSNTPTNTMTPSPFPTSTPDPTATPTVTPTPLPTKTPTPTAKPVESGHKFKPYTGYWAYNLKSSQQYKLQKIAETADNGIRIVKDPNGEWRYCVALGTYWAGGHPQHIGRCLDVYMVNGAVLKCVLADVKKQEDTKNNGNRYGQTNNDILEFIVDESKLPQNVNLKTGGNGNMSGVGEQFEGDVAQIIVFDMWIEGFGK